MATFPYGGIQAPDTIGRDAPKDECCARCRRGIKGFGLLPCGYENVGCPNPNCAHATTKEAR